MSLKFLTKTQWEKSDRKWRTADWTKRQVDSKEKQRVNARLSDRPESYFAEVRNGIFYFMISVNKSELYFVKFGNKATLSWNALINKIVL